VNWVDLLLALVVLLGAWTGWRRGFVQATLYLGTLLLSVALAFAGYRWPAGQLEAHWPALGVWIAPLAFVGSFVLLHALLDGVAGLLIGAVPRGVHVHVANRLLGTVPGAAGGMVNAAVVAIALTILPLFDALSRETRASELARYLAAPAAWVEAQLAPIFDPAIERTLQALTVPAESQASIALKFTVADAPQRADLEAQVLELVNQERAQHGLKPLQADPLLAGVARAHSRDMLARGYFSHVTPEGRKLADRMKAGAVPYLVAAENLALAQTVAIAHRGLMNSPGHRANILRPQFGRLGVGVVDGGRYGLMITQNFRN
jgi:uncharacterized protein YkwD